jgi:hypothetical protein
MMTTGAMLIGVAAAAAQAPGPRPAVLITVRPAPFPDPARSPAALMERLASFDANGDRRISRDELPERMQELVARGDRNADAALDSDEIRSLMDGASSERTLGAFRFQSEGLPGVIKDLKLPSPKRELALAIVGRHKLPRGVNDPAGTALLVEMKALLDDEEYENFVAAAARLSRRPQTID